MDKLIVFTKDRIQAKNLATSWDEKFDLKVSIHRDHVSLAKEFLEDPNLVVAVIGLDTQRDIHSLLAPLVARELLAKVRQANEEIYEAGVDSWGVQQIMKLGGKPKADGRLKEEYSPVKFYDFMHLGVSPCDVYLRLGSENFVKFINGGDLYSTEVLEKFMRKGVDTFYVSTGDLKAFNADLASSLKNEFEYARGNGKMSESIAGIEWINASLYQTGLDAAAIDVAVRVIHQVLDQLKCKPELHKKLSDFFSRTILRR